MIDSRGILADFLPVMPGVKKCRKECLAKSLTSGPPQSATASGFIGIDKVLRVLFFCGEVRNSAALHRLFASQFQVSKTVSGNRLHKWH